MRVVDSNYNWEILTTNDLQKIDLGVPEEPNIRNKEELWVLHKYLNALAKEGTLEFPLVIKKNEAPDFILHKKNKITGIEITELTDKKAKRLLKTKARMIHAPGISKKCLCGLLARAINKKKRNIANYNRNSGASEQVLCIYQNINIATTEFSLKELLRNLDYEFIKSTGFHEIAFISWSWLVYINEKTKRIITL